MADMSRLMKVATKPDRAEIWLVTKVTALGMSGLGLIGFLIKLVGDTIFQGLKHPSTTSPTGALLHTFMQLVTLLIHML